MTFPLAKFIRFSFFPSATFPCALEATLPPTQTIPIFSTPPLKLQFYHAYLLV